MTNNPSRLSDQQFIEMYRKMWLIRIFEERIDAFIAEGKIHGTTHLAIGQEATAVGACSALNPGDLMISTHRNHGHAIAKGTNVAAMMAELFGKSTGTNKGKGGSMHIADLSIGNLGSNGIVGGNYPIAVGAALSSQILGKNQVVLCFSGDGSTNQGSFHESLNLASIWKLPVIFFIENNQYGLSSDIKHMTSIKDLSQRAIAYGIKGITIDGNNVLEVLNATSEAAQRARDGEGPTLIEAKTYRWLGHSKSDKHRIYRTRSEEDWWKVNSDPILMTKKVLIDEGIMTESLANTIKKEANKTIEDAITFTVNSPDPQLSDLTEDVLA
jgi:acetoin:2,6-dichlorophenolindophenol oxidoreductase subunit alpha